MLRKKCEESLERLGPKEEWTILDDASDSEGQRDYWKGECEKSRWTEEVM